MRRLLATLGLIWLGWLATPAQAQTTPTAAPPTAVACAFNSPLLADATTGNAIWVQCDAKGRLLVTDSGTGSVAISSPLGPATTPAASVAAILPDEASICTGSNTCTSTGAGTLSCVDTQNYTAISFTLLTNASGDTVTFENTDDPAGCASTNFYSIAGALSSVSGNGGFAVSTASTTPVVLTFTKRARYWRARVSAGAGTVTNAGNLINAPQILPPIGNTQSVQILAGTAAIGKVGPGFTSAQTPIQGNGTGSTGAVVGTLAAAAAKTTYLCDFDISATGGVATLGPIVVAGLLGGSKTYQLFSTATGANLSKTFTPCLPSSTTNTAITITTTADATASAVDVNSSGYQE